MKEPGEREEGEDRVVRRHDWVVEVSEATLGAENEETADEEVKENGHGGGPPDERVADEVNLAVVLDPEVLHGERRRRRLSQSIQESIRENDTETDNSPPQERP